MLEECCDKVIEFPMTVAPLYLPNGNGVGMGHDDIPYVDPFNDPGVWVGLDEGATVSAHGLAWRENAEQKFRAKNLTLFKYSDWNEPAEGIGETRLTSKWRVP